MTRNEFAPIMAYLQAGIGREFTAATMEVWFDVLGHLDPSDFRYAVKRYLAEQTSGFPTPAHLLRFASDRFHGETLDHGQAFAAVMKAVREFGSYQVAEGMASLAPEIQAAVRASGGFPWFCEMDAESRSTMAAQFRMAYQHAAERHERDRRLPEELRPAIAHERRNAEHVDALPEPLGNVLPFVAYRPAAVKENSSLRPPPPRSAETG